MKPIHWILAFAAPLFLSSSAFSAGVISVNFEGGHGGDPGTAPNALVTGVAGAVPADNWNNALGGTGTINNLTDNTGASTGTSVAWSAANSWSVNDAGAPQPGDSQNGNLMWGYLDNMHDRGPITIDNVPASFQATGYNLLVYHGTDSPGTMGFTVSDGVGADQTLYSNQPGQWNYPIAGADDGFVASTSTDSGYSVETNYTLFSGLSGSSVSIQGVRGTFGDSRARPNGFQLVQIPEPSSALLLVLGSFGLILRRRR